MCVIITMYCCTRKKQGVTDLKYNFIRFPEGKTKAVTLSYDDGSAPDIRFLETIEEYGLKCTFNLVGNSIEHETGLSKAFVKERILGNGHEIAVHGYFHRAQDCVRPVEGIQDVLDCRKILEREFGIIVRGMAYPDRSLNRFKKPLVYEKVKNYLEELDITYARTLGEDNDRFELPEDWYNWMPTAHHNNPHLFEYIDKFVSLDVNSAYIASRNARLFYLWGHSFEFENNNNWDLLRTICEKLSGNDDVWYATNGEIYEYVNAYKSLVYSADGEVVYNPTLIDVWFDVDKTLYRIKPGETLKLSV